jgi:hypothetical protein
VASPESAGAAIVRKGKARKPPKAKARKGSQTKLRIVNDQIVADRPRPPLPPLDPLLAAQEAAHHALEGNLKLSRSVDILREGLETIVIAEVDRRTGIPVGARELRELAAACLDRYSTHTGQNWRLPRNKLTGATRAGRAVGQKASPRNLPREADGYEGEQE